MSEEVIKEQESKSQKDVHVVKKGGFLSILSFLISIGSLGVVGYIWLELEKANQTITDSLSNQAVSINTKKIQELNNQFSFLNQELSKLDENYYKNQSKNSTLFDQIKTILEIQKDLTRKNSLFDTQLSVLPKQSDLIAQKELIINLQESYHKLSKHLDEAISMNRQKWRMIESDHLVRLAQLRLNALQDLDSAEALLLTASDILIEQNDPTSYSVRQFLQNSLQEIKITERPDRTTIFLKLGGMIDNIKKLTPYHLEDYKSKNEMEQLAKGIEDEVWYKNVLKIMSGYFRISFSEKDTLKPMISGQTLEQIKLALSLSLEQAQWAALNGKTKIYQRAISQAQTLLEESFNASQQSTKSLLNDLKDLKNKTVWVKMPDLTDTLESLDLYIKRKQSIDNKKENALFPNAESLKNSSEKELDDINEIQE